MRDRVVMSSCEVEQVDGGSICETKAGQYSHEQQGEIRRTIEPVIPVLQARVSSVSASPSAIRTRMRAMRQTKKVSARTRKRKRKDVPRQTRSLRACKTSVRVTSMARGRCLTSE